MSTTTSTITGTDAPEVLQGTSAPDLILGLAGDDILMGGDGDDTLVGGLGADTFYASGGSDTFVIDGASRDVLGVGFAPIPYISDPAAVQTVRLPAGITPDKLRLASDGFDLTLRLADPAAPTGLTDILYVGRNEKTPKDPRFIDRIEFDNGTVWTSADIDNVLYTQRLITTTGDDLVEGGARDDSVSGLAGNDHMVGDGGNDTLAGDEGRDLLSAHTGDDSLLGGDGEDTIYGDEGNDTLLGDLGSDLLDGGTGTDLISGGNGDDSLYSAGGDDVLNGGDGNDLLSTDSYFGNWRYPGTADRVLMLGGAGDDHFYADVNATLEGGAGFDTYELGAPAVAGEGNVIRFGLGGDRDLLLRGSAVLQFESGVRPEDVVVRLDAGSLLTLGQDFALVDALSLRLELPGGQDAFLAMDQWTGTGAAGGISSVAFADGTQWDQATLQSKYAQGSADDDLILGFTGRNNTLSGQNGNDRLYGMDGQDLILGGAGGDLMLGQFGDDTLQGGAGNDTLNGGLGRDLLVGGAGDDTYAFTRNKAGSSVLDLTADGAAPTLETDRVLMGHGLRNSDIKLSRDGVDLIIESRYLSSQTGQPERMRVLGQFQLDAQGREAALLDQIVFLDDLSWSAAEISERSVRVENLVTEGNDEIFGDSQANALEGRGGQDQLFGFEGNDTLTGGDGSDVIDGGKGNDLLLGGEHWDALIGGDGNDTLDGGLKADTMTGGSGNDHYYVDSADDQVIEKFNDFSAGIDTVATNLDDYTLPLGVENLVMGGKEGLPPDQRTFLAGKAGVRHGIGNGVGNLMTGGDGAELFEGLEGDDTLIGGGGKDTLVGGDGADQLIGGLGDDTYVLRRADSLLNAQGYSAADVIVEQSVDGSGIDTVDTDFATYTAPDNIEQVFSTGFVINGNVLNNLLRGGGEQNSLSGMAGNDTLEGGGGNDQYSGGLGNDLLVAADASSNDVYVWARGDGADVAMDAGGDDRLIIGGAVKQDQLWFSRTGDDLQIAIIGSADSFTAQGWFQGAEHQIERISLAQGKDLVAGKVQQLVDAMASFTPPAPGQTALPADVAAQLAPVIASAWG